MNYLSSDDKAIKNSHAFFSNVTQIPMHKELASQPYSPLIALMTTDYLLTARDLPGWAGRFPEIDYKVMLVKCIEELAHGLYSDNRLARELKILYAIAEHHRLDDFFTKRLKQKRKYVKKKPIEGNAISINRLFLDCSMYEVNNIFEASYMISLMYRVLPKLSFQTIYRSIINSIIFKWTSNRKGSRFPKMEEWL